MRYRYTVELTVDELDFSATEAEHLRAALREAAEECFVRSCSSLTVLGMV